MIIRRIGTIWVIVLLMLAQGGALASAAAAAASTSGFSDVPASHWAKSAIDQVTAKGYMGGYPDGTFKPGGTITRAEFTAVLVRLAAIPSGTSMLFTDIAGHWAGDAIRSAGAAGLIAAGDYGTAFQPNKPITRLEMARMTARTLEKTEGYAAYFDAFKKLYNGDLPFVDFRDIKQADLPFIGLSFGAKIMSGYPDASFGMGKNATRAEAAVMFVSLADSRTKKPESYQYLRELKEVAETGMNAETVSDLIPQRNLVTDKPAIVDHANFSAKIKRVYVVPLDGKVSLYERKFLWDRNDPNIPQQLVKNKKGIVVSVLDVTFKKDGDSNTFGQYIFMNPSSAFYYQEPFKRYLLVTTYSKTLYKAKKELTDEVVIYGKYNEDTYNIGLQTNYATSGSYFQLLVNSEWKK